MMNLLERNKDHVFTIHDILAIISAIVTIPNRKSPAVDPYQDCFLTFSNLWLSPYVDGQTILTERISCLCEALQELNSCLGNIRSSKFFFSESKPLGCWARWTLTLDIRSVYMSDQEELHYIFGSIDGRAPRISFRWCKS